MNTHEKYIRDTNQYEKYIAWLEEQVSYEIVEDNDGVHCDFDQTGSHPIDKVKEIIDNYEESYTKQTYISYDEPDLSYQTQIIFPRVLTLQEKEQVEGLINYWSAFPYVSVEGNYGIEWSRVRDYSIVTVDIDFTKSASDDYCSREILEQLAEFIWHGTPVKRNNKRTIEGVILPVAVRADNV